MNLAPRSRFGKRSIPVLALFSVLIILSLACSSLSGGAPATPAPADTSKPADTAQPQPTDTAKATPNRTATKLSQNRATQSAQTAVAGAVLDEIGSKLEEVGESLGNGTLLFMADQPIEIVSSKHNIITYQLLDATGADFAMYSDVTWSMKDNKGIANCAFLYRMGEDINYDNWYAVYLSRISGGSNIWFEINGLAYGYSDNFYSAYIKDANGAENEMLLTVVGNQHTAYVNGKQVGVWFNTRASSGGFGVAALQDTGTTTCTFNDLWIWGWD